jgi:hypothetical protein
MPINKKSLILAVLLGFASWFWAFIIVGSAFYDYTTNKPITNPNIGFYVILLIINAVLSIIVFALYLWKYEQTNPILPEKWSLDAILIGIIICGMNFLLDALFFGGMGRNLLTYFFLETTTGYFYPLIILEIYLLAYFIYGKNK